MDAPEEIYPPEENRRTALCIAYGLVIALLITAPMIGRWAGDYWAIDRFPWGSLTTGMSWIGIMFHEIGHALFYWLYGYIALPGFDFSLRCGIGGITVALSDQIWLLFIFMIAINMYFIYRLRFFPVATIPLSLLLLTQLHAKQNPAICSTPIPIFIEICVKSFKTFGSL